MSGRGEGAVTRLNGSPPCLVVLLGEDSKAWCLPTGPRNWQPRPDAGSVEWTAGSPGGSGVKAVGERRGYLTPDVRGVSANQCLPAEQGRSERVQRPPQAAQCPAVRSASSTAPIPHRPSPSPYGGYGDTSGLLADVGSVEGAGEKAG